MAMDEQSFARLKEKVWAFMKEDIYPNELKFHEQQEHIFETQGNNWTHPPILIELMEKAKACGLWNMFLPVDSAQAAGISGMGLSNLQYGDICEILGTANHAEFAAQATNCTSPDTGNMEVLARFGTTEQKKMWLEPLLSGEIRSCYAMTEPAVASSDASNITIRIERDERAGQYVINGQKWWITGAGNSRCKIMILMGKTNPAASKYKQQSQLLVPMDTPGITLLRPMLVMGDNDCPKGHFHIDFNDVRVPFANAILGEGRGFEISQARLGPGRIHHCMRAIGQAERALSLMCSRAQERTAFGKKLSQFDTVVQQLGQNRARIDQARMLIREAADRMDKLGNKDAKTRQMLAMVKAVVPQMVQEVLDSVIQVHGAMGVSQDTFLPSAFINARSLRLADGPDEVHWMTAAKIELAEQRKSPLYAIGPYRHDIWKKPFKTNPQPKSKL